MTSWEAITKNRCPSSVSRCLSNPRLEPQSTKIGTNPHRAAKWGCVRPHGPRSCFYRARACAWVYLGPPSNRGHQAKRLRATRDHRPVANNSAKKTGSATHAGHTGPCTPDSPCARLKTLIRVQGHLETSRQANPAHVSRTRSCFATASHQKEPQKDHHHLKEANPQPQRRHPPCQARRPASQALQER